MALFHAGRRAVRLSVRAMVVLALAVAGLIVPRPQPAAAMEPASFIRWVAPMAQQGERNFHVPSSVSIAQAILESGWGESRLTKEANSFFGIKCFAAVSQYQNGCYEIATKEYNSDGTEYTITARFRKYNSPELSFQDHGSFLTLNSRYANAFNYSNNPDRFAFEIHKAGYATDPEYTSSLISIMRKYNLYQYDVTPKSSAVTPPAVFGITNRSVAYGTKTTFIAAFYADPSREVTWQQSKDGKAWQTITPNTDNTITSYGYRSIYTRQVLNDDGLLIRATVKNGSGQTATSAPGKITVTGSAKFTRLAGEDRYETAVKVSQAQFADGAAPTVYIATGTAFPDALAGGAAAARSKGGLLLVAPGSIPSIVAAELTRLKPSSIVIQGGTGAVSSAVEKQLATFTKGQVRRNAGLDRYATAISTSQQAFTSSPVAMIATGEDFADALSAGSLFSNQLGPILLTEGQGALSAATTTELKRLGTKTVYLLGGDGVVPAAVETQLRSLGYTVVRLAGPERYDTALEVAKKGFPTAADTVYLATGLDFPDGLASGPIAAAKRGPVILVKGTCVPQATVAYVQALRPQQIVLIGGSGVLSDSVGRLVAC